ncbi:MAG: methyltransferase domain-containing protein [Pseudomonadota bacterium]|nr:methyltransferase domain-containing protein [Pseudomonadota bacterium]
MVHWEEKYQANTIPWDRGASSPALHRWLEADALAHGRILIPGCGRGHEAMELARRGFLVTALDIAPTALKQLKTELVAAGLTAELVCADALSWQPDASFDAIYEQTCLCALPPDQWTRYERQLFDWLKPGGHLYALFMQADRDGGPPFHCELADMRTLFPPARWTWPDTEPERESHPIGMFELATVLVRSLTDR